MRAKPINPKEEKAKRVRYIQNENIAVRSVDDSFFLVGPKDQSIFYLNTIGSGVWRLLNNPISELEIDKIIQEAYPDIPDSDVSSDISKLISELKRKGLIRQLD